LQTLKKIHQIVTIKTLPWFCATFAEKCQFQSHFTAILGQKSAFEWTASARFPAQFEFLWPRKIGAQNRVIFSRRKMAENDQKLNSKHIPNGKIKSSKEEITVKKWN
jgi:hypothetical protein